MEIPFWNPGQIDNLGVTNPWSISGNSNNLAFMFLELRSLEALPGFIACDPAPLNEQAGMFIPGSLEGDDISPVMVEYEDDIRTGFEEWPGFDHLSGDSVFVIAGDFMPQGHTIDPQLGIGVRCKFDGGIFRN
ncbi:MAG: hypothetical protein UZ16_OP3001000979 [Candidatus Hinthialibacteria bacterium OLB16]|nr:MAG: hypothetical protein UZ16_OP3001000979 [Candidatus Hinthialibacteria bacterium OLB16]